MSEQISAIGALVAMVDGETPTGQAVLKAVGRDLDAAYSKLVVYLKRQDSRTAYPHARKYRTPHSYAYTQHGGKPRPP